MIEDEQSGRNEHVGPFDFIFLAAGCIGTAQIVPITQDSASVIIDASGITVSVPNAQPVTTSLVGADVVIVPVYGSGVTVDASAFATQRSVSRPERGDLRGHLG